MSPDHSPSAPALLSFTIHVHPPPLFHSKRSPSPQSRLSSLPHCHVFTFHDCKGTSASQGTAGVWTWPCRCLLAWNAYFAKEIQDWISCDWNYLRLPKPFFFFLSLSVSGFCFKSPTLMWKRCPGTMCGQKAWQTHKENAQVKMGMLLHFSNEHVASSWYFMTLTRAKSISIPLSYQNTCAIAGSDVSLSTPVETSHC